MRFVSVAMIGMLPSLVVSDYNLWFQGCSTGLGEYGQDWQTNIAATDQDGACNGCTVDGDVGRGDASGGNPVSNVIHRNRELPADHLVF